MSSSGGHGELAQRHADAQRRGAVGDTHGIVHLAGHSSGRVHGRLLNGFDRQQRGLGLDVVDILGVIDAGVRHRGAHGFGDLFDHGRTADVLGHQFCELMAVPMTSAVVAGGAGLVVARKGHGVGCDDAVATAGPDHREFA